MIELRSARERFRPAWAGKNQVDQNNIEVFSKRTKRRKK